MTFINHVFDIIWNQIHASYDNQFLQPAGNIQLVIAKKSQITGSQTGTFVVVLCKSMENLIGFFWFIPVSFANGVIHYPNFPNHILWQQSPCIGVNNKDFGVVPCFSARRIADHVLVIRSLHNNLIRCYFNPISIKISRLFGLTYPANHQGGFSKSITGKEYLVLKIQ